MKTTSLFAFSVFAALLPSFASAQTLISYVGVTTSNQQPGSATDFIDFYSGDYPTGGPSNNHTVNNGTITSDLNSFTIQGGVRPENSGGANYSVITTPAGQAFLTGAIVAEPGIAFALTPGVNTGSGYVLNPTFNYNDFDVYLMFSNTNNSLTSNGSNGGIQNDATISIDPRNSAQNVAFGTNDVAVSDNTNATTMGGTIGASPTTAQYIEFHITGLGSSIAADPAADLVVSANLPSGTPFESYIGGVSFVSNAVPEPSTYAMMLVGGLGLLVLVRRHRAGLSA